LLCLFVEKTLGIITRGAFFMKTVSVLNYKGGVGKTTLTACTSQALALTGFRVLAIDNDPQHNLCYMLGASIDRPTIRDVYHGSVGAASQILNKAIRKTTISNLHVIPSSNDLCVNDVKDPYLLQKCFAFLSLEKTYDYILIDNSPGLDVLQESSIHASNEIFVPTELSQFAINGICDMRDMMLKKFPGDCSISKIIPNFYRNLKADDAYILALNTYFPGIVTKTTIPFNIVFDTLVKEQKILFLHRLSSIAAAHYIKLIHELFNLDEETTWEMVKAGRKKRISSEARERFLVQRLESKKKLALEKENIPNEPAELLPLLDDSETIDEKFPSLDDDNREFILPLLENSPENDATETNPVESEPKGPSYSSPRPIDSQAL
jgi:chromosome partitioning protein